MRLTGEILEFTIQKSGKDSIINRESLAFSGLLVEKYLEKSGNITQLSKPIILDIIKNLYLIALSHECTIRTVNEW
jgi:hypothetical protein